MASRTGQALGTSASFVAIIWIVQTINYLLGGLLTNFGIHPRDMYGLAGIIFAPFLHANWAHLISNSLACAVLLFLVAFGGRQAAWLSSVIIALVAGLGTWLIGPSYSVHIGASSLIFGWVTYLIFRGLYTRKLVHILLGLIVAVVYGSVLWGVLPGTPGVSWQGHLFGALGGVLAAGVMGKRQQKSIEPERIHHVG